jgi:Cell division protein ZapA
LLAEISNRADCSAPKIWLMLTEARSVVRPTTASPSYYRARYYDPNAGRFIGKIYDQMYNVNGDQDEEYLKELAAYVDSKMRSIAEIHPHGGFAGGCGPRGAEYRDEMFTVRQKQQEVEGPLRKRVEKCVSMVEKALEQSIEH